MKKSFGFAYGFKSQCTYINKRFYKLEYCLQSRPNNQRNIFPPFGNELLTPSVIVSLKGLPILYILKHKDLYNYIPICIMSSGLMINNITVNKLRNKKL